MAKKAVNLRGMSEETYKKRFELFSKLKIKNGKPENIMDFDLQTYERGLSTYKIK